jgi:hypothetical protein
MTNPNKMFNPDECIFIGSLNELQQTLQETKRQRIRAEEKILTMHPEDENYNLFLGYLKICKLWEDELIKELIERIPEDQQRLL